MVQEYNISFLFCDKFIHYEPMNYLVAFHETQGRFTRPFSMQYGLAV